MNDNDLCKLMVSKYNIVKNEPDDVVMDDSKRWRATWLQDGLADSDQMERCAKQIMWYIDEHGEVPTYDK